MIITAAMVARLREETNETMMDCKMALVEFEGDFDKALDYLQNTPVHVRYRSRTDWRCNCCECRRK